MAKSSSSVAGNVAARANGLDKYLRRIERLRNSGKLLDKDAERAYSGGFVEFHAYVERAIEELFTGLLRGRLVSSDSSVRAKISVKSDAVAMDIIRGHRSYVDWLPYEQYTARRAQAFFASGKPFNRLDKADLAALAESTVIRNALAHQSGAALKRFKKRLVENRHLPPDQSRPAGYLRGFHSVGQTRMNYHLARMVLVIDRLAK